jgi:ferrous iron transport protein A
LQVIDMKLKEAMEGKEYTVRSLETEDEEFDAFLFSLGCYAGEKITVVTKRRRGCVVAIKEGRYSIDDQLANAIEIA